MVMFSQLTGVIMKSTKPVIILTGQIYLDSDKNSYLVVTRKLGEVVSYAGCGFKGMLEDEVFIGRFQPVDPLDVEKQELDTLLAFCSTGTSAKVGFIKD